MNGEFVTSDSAISTTLGYLYGADSLVKIALDGREIVRTFSVPTEDARIIVEDYERGELAIADLLAWFKEQSRQLGSVRAMQRRGETNWCSKFWVAGVDAQGNKIK
jgi:hypothetical protein